MPAREQFHLAAAAAMEATMAGKILNYGKRYDGSLSTTGTRISSKAGRRALIKLRAVATSVLARDSEETIFEKAMKRAPLTPEELDKLME